MSSKSSLHPGVTFYEDDREKGPFCLRIGGTSEFVSEIDVEYSRCWPPGKVEVVAGWGNPQALMFDTMESALEAADHVWSIEGFHTSVETLEHVTPKDDWTCSAQGELLV